MAAFDPSERLHGRCADALQRSEKQGLFTSEAVVTEAMHLLGFSREAQAAFQLLLSSDRICVEAVSRAERPGLVALMRRYANVPMDYADGTLVVLADRLDMVRVLTLDSDFGVYRLGRRPFERLPI